MTATVIWRNSEALNAALDIKCAAVLISAALVVLVSLATGRESPAPGEKNPL
jgi:hypothetical protein